MAKLGPNTSIELVASANTQTLNEPVTSTALMNDKEHEQEMSTLKEELAAQEALRAR